MEREGKEEEEGDGCPDLGSLDLPMEEVREGGKGKEGHLRRPATSFCTLSTGSRK